jgi:hypothetical protein
MADKQECTRQIDLLKIFCFEPINIYANLSNTRQTEKG